jgi:alpha-ketoglutarate-dependent taurine dioxygenase
VKPLSAAVGAEIFCVDLRQELPAQTIADIIDAWHEHAVGSDHVVYLKHDRRSSPSSAGGEYISSN